MVEASDVERMTVANKFEAVISEIERMENPPTPQLCFCRKYSKPEKANYIFYRANMQPEVYRTIGKFLKDNVNELEDKTEVDGAEDILEDCYFTIQLNEIITWDIFEGNAFSISTQELEDIKKLKTNLNSFIIYYKFNNKLIGQIRRITPRNVLDQQGILFKMLFDGTAFNKIYDEKDVTIDKFYDFMFLVEYEVENEGEEEILNLVTNYGIVKDYENHCSIFNMDAQYTIEARNIVSSCDIFNNFENSTRVKEIINGDKTLQRTLSNPVCKDAFENIQPNNIIEIKSSLNSNVKFDIDTSGRITLPESDEKVALKEFIRSVGRYYNKSIYGESRIIEGKPLRVIDSMEE